jgi:hypothetical protein
VPRLFRLKKNSVLKTIFMYSFAVSVLTCGVALGSLLFATYSGFCMFQFETNLVGYSIAQMVAGRCISAASRCIVLDPLA